mgnify:CR=1 FL=1
MPEKLPVADQADSRWEQGMELPVIPALVLTAVFLAWGCGKYTNTLKTCQMAVYCPKNNSFPLDFDTLFPKRLL